MEPLTNEARNQHLKVKICVSGTADTANFNDNILTIAKEVGAEIARQGAVIVTGATTGFPLWSARGAKEAGGFSIGLSPAETEGQHIKEWKLPLEYMDVIIYTGQGFPGRDILLTRTSDAIIIGPGRIGTFHEFTVAFEDNKPLGVLEGDWLTDDIIKDILANAHRPNEMVIFDADPKKLVAKLIEMVKARKIK
ncbi:hypothetical protein BK005_01050 [bacterium CG10_37_50]|nr:MAG: hypothetical protein BK005_01050 [bacterium CG10_37_50]